jgi:hypothetical protein
MACRLHDGLQALRRSTALAAALAQHTEKSVCVALWGDCICVNFGEPAFNICKSLGVLEGMSAVHHEVLASSNSSVGAVLLNGDNVLI